jgi:cytochrome c553
MNPTPKKRIKPLFLNVAFLLFCGAILFFLFNAPKETTAKLPKDSNHSRFQEMGKKEAEKFCTECHTPEGVSPLPEGHPPKYRCLFCHKRD